MQNCAPKIHMKFIHEAVERILNPKFNILVELSEPVPAQHQSGIHYDDMFPAISMCKPILWVPHMQELVG